jgi:hypothetical protein
MRQLPRNKTKEHKIIILATDDYFGEGCSPEDRKLKTNICLWIMGRKKRVLLNDEQKEAVEVIRNNLADITYRKNLVLCLN